MKVMCIIQPENITYTPTGSHKSTIGESVFVGEVYTVILADKGFSGVMCYILEEKDPDVGFAVKYFAPLSSIDETELIKERLQKV